ncbi:hypothetical protein HDV05_002939 [Chytridiales sp. JEL 0842]|nr:hypothetical protein HDV05_002939 [Chytridiales sp. JEL 0842]
MSSAIQYLGDPLDPNYIRIDMTLPTLQEMYALHIVALVFIGCSLFGSLYMIVRTIQKGKYTTIGERFPLYLSFLSLFWSIAHTIDHSWMIHAAGANPPPAACSALGATLGLFMMAEIMLVNLLAISMFLTVYMNWSLSYGKGDWILVVLTFGVPVTFVCFGLGFNAFGHDYFYCFINVTTRAGHILLGIILAAAIACICLPAACFYLIYAKVASHTRNINSISKSSSNGAQSSNNQSATLTTTTMTKEQQRQNKIVAKLVEYQLALVLTFSCLIAYTATIVIWRKEPIPLIFWVVISFNSNGFVNFLVFIRHEYMRKMEKAAGASAHNANQPTGSAIESAHSYVKPETLETV